MRKSRNMHSFPFRRSNPPELAKDVSEAPSDDGSTTFELKGFKRASGIGTVRSCGKLSRQATTTTTTMTQNERPPSETSIVAIDTNDDDNTNNLKAVEDIHGFGVSRDERTLLEHSSEMVPAIFQKIKMSTKKPFNKYMSFKPASRPLLENLVDKPSSSSSSSSSSSNQINKALVDGTREPGKIDDHQENIKELKYEQYDQGLDTHENMDCVVEEVLTSQEGINPDIFRGQFVPTPVSNPASVENTLYPRNPPPNDARSIVSSSTVVTKPFVCGSHGSTFMYILDTSGTLQCGEFLYDASGGMAFVGAYMTGPSELGSLSDRLIWRIVAGQSHFIALDTTGKVHAWGDNSYGQVGSSVLRQCEILPVEVIPAGIVHIAAGHYFSIALDEAGIVWSWGSNDHGQLGQCTYDDCSRPYPIQRGSLLGRQISCIAAGECHSLAVDSLGQVHAWGDNRFGQLGNHRGSVRVATPAHVSSFGSLNGRFVSRVISGANTSMAVDVSGSLHVWGRVNANTTLCPSGTYRDTSNYWTPFLTDPGIPRGETIDSIIAGSTYATILTSTRELYTAALGDTRTSPIVFRKIALTKAQYIASVGVYNWAYMPLDNESNDMTYWNLVGLL